ncbi:hypothetical protein BJX64DRAFT_268851 [Aspergillus heterothallicus]
MFLTEIQDNPFVLKVNHGRGPRQYYKPKDWEVNHVKLPHVNDSRNEVSPHAESNPFLWRN